MLRDGESGAQATQTPNGEAGALCSFPQNQRQKANSPEVTESPNRLALCEQRSGTPLRLGTGTNFHGRSCSLIFRSRVGSIVSKKIPSPRFSPGSCPKAPASPPVLFVNEYQKPPVLPRFSSQMPPVLPRFFWAPPVLPRFPRFSPGSPPVFPTLYANREN